MFCARISIEDGEMSTTQFSSTEECWEYLAEVRRNGDDNFKTKLDPQTNEKYDRILRCLGPLGEGVGKFTCKDGVEHDSGSTGVIFDSDHKITYAVEVC